MGTSTEPEESVQDVISKGFALVPKLAFSLTSLSMSAMQVLVQEKTVHHQQCSYFEGAAASFKFNCYFSP